MCNSEKPRWIFRIGHLEIPQIVSYVTEKLFENFFEIDWHLMTSVDPLK